MPSGYYNRLSFTRPPKSKSGLKGVIFYPNLKATKQWKAYLRKNGQYYTIGYYKTKTEAAIAYNKAMLKMFGKEAWMNPIRREEVR